MSLPFAGSSGVNANFRTLGAGAIANARLTGLGRRAAGSTQHARFGSMHRTCAIPYGRYPSACYDMAMTAGGLNGPVDGSGETDAAIFARGIIAANADGDGTLQGTLWGTIYLVALAIGDGTLAAAIQARALLEGSVDVGALPSAEDNAGELMATIVENGLSVRDVLRLILAVQVGKTSVATGPVVVTFRDTADSKDRVVAGMTGKTRTTVTLDPS